MTNGLPLIGNGGRLPRLEPRETQLSQVAEAGECFSTPSMTQVRSCSAAAAQGWTGMLTAVESVGTW